LDYLRRISNNGKLKEFFLHAACHPLH
jgi:hypothetical protein